MMTMYSGKWVDPLNLKPDDITITDLAHHLACVNRFAGALLKPISVAQHSVMVSRLLQTRGHDKITQLQGLLHDGSEAFISDIVKWVKATDDFIGYRALEDRIQELIYTKFGCPPTMLPAVELADHFMVRHEALKGYKKYPFTRPDYPKPTLGELEEIGSWQPWTWRISEELFLERFRAIERL